jgi:hypothetical protein
MSTVGVVGVGYDRIETVVTAVELQDDQDAALGPITLRRGSSRSGQESGDTCPASEQRAGSQSQSDEIATS